MSENTTVILYIFEITKWNIHLYNLNSQTITRVMLQFFDELNTIHIEITFQKVVIFELATPVVTMRLILT